MIIEINKKTKLQQKISQKNIPKKMKQLIQEHENKKRREKGKRKDF